LIQQLPDKDNIRREQQSREIDQLNQEAHFSGRQKELYSEV